MDAENEKTALEASVVVIEKDLEAPGKDVVVESQAELNGTDVGEASDKAVEASMDVSKPEEEAVPSVAETCVEGASPSGVQNPKGVLPGKKKVVKTLKKLVKKKVLKGGASASAAAAAVDPSLGESDKGTKKVAADSEEEDDDMESNADEETVKSVGKRLLKGKKVQGALKTTTLKEADEGTPQNGLENNNNSLAVNEQTNGVEKPSEQKNEDQTGMAGGRRRKRRRGGKQVSGPNKKQMKEEVVVAAATDATQKGIEEEGKKQPGDDLEKDGQGNVKHAGLIFMCNAKTRPDCFRLRSIPPIYKLLSQFLFFTINRKISSFFFFNIMYKRVSLSFPEEVLEHVFSFIHVDKDRNSVSLVCKSWYEIERWCRRKVFVGNCYAVSPGRVIRRFPKLRSVELKGKPHFADFNLVPEGWGGYVYPWIEAMSTSYTWLEEIRLKRMVVSDECLELIAKSFKNFKVLVLSSCEGFSTDGLAAIAASCRNLRELDLRESDVDDVSGHWLSHFPDTYTSLVSLNISCLSSELSFSALERLVTRCPSLKSLKLNRAVPLEKLAILLQRAPQLEEFGTGGYTADVRPDVFSDLSVALSGCKKLKCLSGFWDAAPAYLPAVYSVCCRVTTLNLSYATVQSYDLVKLLSQCPKLQRLWVLDYIEDTGLEVLASTCKDLRELRVFPSDPFVMEANVALTEQGLVSVSMGCPKLESVLYFCRQMTNDALVTIARNRPNMTRFRLCIIEPKAPDHMTLEPLDVGFGAIVEHCKDLRRLSLSGLLTDKVFEYIGTYAKKMEMLSVAFAGESDLGMHHVLSGCDSLRKLEIRDCPFGDKALLANASKLETMRSLWMSSCSVSFGACKLLGQKMPKLNVEVIDERGPPDSRPESCPVERVFIYRTVAGPRFDMPGFVWNMDQQHSTMRVCQGNGHY